jgi:hypothetical protein
MKRATFLAITYANLVLLCAGAIRGAPPEPGSPEAVVAKATDAINHGRIDEFVSAMHPDALEELRTAIVGSVDDAVKKVGEAKVLESFPEVKTVAALKALDGPTLFAGVLRRMTADPNAKEALAKTQIDVLGHITEGKDTVHVVYRSKMKLGELEIPRLNVASLRKKGQDWKMAIPDEFGGTMKQAAAGPANLAIDISKTQVEPIGHLIDGQEALIVYRTKLPVSDSSITKLAVMPLSARDPAFEAVRADKMAEVKALLESRLGFRAMTAPASKGAVPAKSSQAPPRAVTKAMPRVTRAPAKAKIRKTQPSTAGADASELPGGLVALPATFGGGNRDRFHDIAPDGGVLVGASVSYIMRFGGPKISSIQPIYRVGEKLVNGERRGGLLGKETTAVAKPGYAVGALNTRTGLTVDGFEMVFMRIDGDRLNTADSYKSEWLGDTKGGNPRDVSSDGKIPVGLQGRAAREVNALGLIVKK